MELPQPLPRFYQRWLGADYGHPFETRAVTCLACEMVNPIGRTRDLGPFTTRLKCCTFHPFLPSFSIGALFLEAADDSARLQRLNKYLAASRLSPLGAFPRKSQPTSICETGKMEATRCHFLSNDENAVCTIRDHRPSPCAGYVCKSSQGEAGFYAWRAWEGKVAEFEWSLAHLTAFELGYTLDDVDQEFSSYENAKTHFERAFKASLAIEYGERG